MIQNDKVILHDWKMGYPKRYPIYGAANQIWTGDLVLTKDVLYLLSHSSITIKVHTFALFRANPLILYVKRLSMSNNFARKIYKNFFIVPPFSVRHRIFKCRKSLLQQKRQPSILNLSCRFIVYCILVTVSYSISSFCYNL